MRYRLGNTIRDLTYDAGDRIVAYTHYDAVSAASVPSLNQSFGYDELARLTSITTATATWGIGYDANGNRTSLTLNGLTGVYTTPSTSNRLTGTTNPTRGFGYDNAGNTLTTTTTSPTTATYNAENRLATMRVGTVTTTYAYDALGQRTRKFSSSGAAFTVIFVYDPQGRLLGEYNSAGTAIRELVWLDGEPMAVFTPNGTNPPNVFYVHNDHIQTPRVVTNQSGVLRWTWMGEPFGTTAANTNPAWQGAFTFNLRHPGQYADAESGLFYNYFRDYDATIGRYVQSDPIGLAGGINTYAYVGANPLKWTDPTGLKSRVCCRDIPGIGVFGFRHCYVETLGRSGSTTTFGLIGGSLSGQPSFTGSIFINNGFDVGGVCGEWVDECTTDQCVKDESDFYPNPSQYLYTGPNSNTFAGTIARKCRLPRPDLWQPATPGWDDGPAPQRPGEPYRPPTINPRR